jgi:hypothetical protein
VKFSGCMRAHGVTAFPDPTIGSNGLPSWTLNSANESPQSPVFKGAQRVCRADLPHLGPQTAAEKAAANAEALKYAVCMRSNGVPNFPDPNGQGMIDINSATGALNPSSPQFEKASTSCKSLDNGFGEQVSVAEQASHSGTGGS